MFIAQAYWIVPGVENVSAKDDLGNVLVSEQRGFGFINSSGGAYPDEWSGGVSLGTPHPKARKLIWLEGEFVVYRSVRPVTIEIPLPLKEKVVKRGVGDLLVAASRFHPTPPAEEDDDLVITYVLTRDKKIVDKPKVFRHKKGDVAIIAEALLNHLKLDVATH